MPKAKIGKASQKALHQIQKKHLSPRPVWQFRLLSVALWFGVALSFVLGGLSLSVFLFMLRTNDWDLAYIPIFWVIMLFTFWLLSPRLLASTRYGYRLTSRQFVFFNFAISLVLGVILVQTRLPRLLDTTLQQASPVYGQLVPHKQDFWNQPNAGRLSGVIISKENGTIKLKDWQGNLWTVIIRTDITPDMNFSATIIRPRVKLVIGEEIKIFGKTQDKSLFEAREIRPWQGRGERNPTSPLY